MFEGIAKTSLRRPRKPYTRDYRSICGIPHIKQWLLGKDGIVVNSDFINGMKVKEAGKCIIEKVKEMGIGYGTVNYRLRDAIFSRQRYWGEPFPVYYKNGMPYMLSDDQLPLLLPEIDEYKPTETGEPPLARAANWTYQGYPMEYSTMPGFAGSSGYYLRYMDPHNDKEFLSKEKNEYSNVSRSIVAVISLPLTVISIDSATCPVC